MGREPSIILHKEYGLNPTMSVCIICGKETGEIVLLGAGYKKEAPRHMITSVEPCKKCREKYLKEGVMIAEAKKGYRKSVPTGSITVIKESAFKKLFTIAIPKRRIVFMEPEDYRKIFSKQEKN